MSNSPKRSALYCSFSESNKLISLILRPGITVTLAGLVTWTLVRVVHNNETAMCHSGFQLAGGNPSLKFTVRGRLLESRILNPAYGPLLLLS